MEQHQEPIDQLPADAQTVAGIDLEAFRHGYTLSNAEALTLIGQYVATSKQKPGGDKWQPTPILKKTEEWLNKFSKPMSTEVLEKLRGQTNNYGVKQFEHVILCNLMPETPEEAYAVLPSLKDRLTEEQLALLLEELRQTVAYT